MASAQQLKMLKRALRCYDVDVVCEIVMGYLERALTRFRQNRLRFTAGAEARRSSV